MKNTKDILALSLATMMTMAPMTTFAEVVKAETINDGIKVEGNVEVKELTDAEKNQDIQLNFEVKESEYISRDAEIKKVTITEDKKSGSILVEQTLEDDKKNEMIYLISEEVTLVDGSTRSTVKIEDLKEGMKVKVFFGRNTPMLLSYPGQMTPKVIAIDNMEDGSIFVDTFDDELISKGYRLKLNISEETEIVNTKGEKVEDIKGKDLIVFFGASTRSIPAQTVPFKVIVLEDKQIEAEIKVEDVEEVEEVKVSQKVFNKLVVREETIELETEMYQEGEVTMVPVRELAEALGYTVDWISEDNSVKVYKGEDLSSLRIGDNKYTFDEEVELEIAPELKGTKTFVPVSFFENLLRTKNASFNADGILEIK